MRPRIIAVDFDGTLVTDEFPNIGTPNRQVMEYVREQAAQGCIIILWTCRCGLYLQQAVQHCVDLHIPFHYINENPDCIKEEFGGDPRKVFADVYIDDRSEWPKHIPQPFKNLPEFGSET